ncbi:hypothetical protein SAMN05192544_11033 [Paraburkholderia hospita]|nr:hypothetical protein SAMN05192544_11033 [Paraburkholderia hospita]
MISGKWPAVRVQVPARKLPLIESTVCSEQHSSNWCFARVKRRFLHVRNEQNGPSRSSYSQCARRLDNTRQWSAWTAIPKTTSEVNKEKRIIDRRRHSVPKQLHKPIRPSPLPRSNWWPSSARSCKPARSTWSYRTWGTPACRPSASAAPTTVPSYRDFRRRSTRRSRVRYRQRGSRIR